MSRKATKLPTADDLNIDGRTNARLINRTAFLKAADALFCDKGYDATSTRDIITAAGLGLGTFYNHFRDKEDIFRVILEEHNAHNIPAQRQYRLGAATFHDFVMRHYEWFFRHIFEDRRKFDLFNRNSAVIRTIMSGPNEIQGLAFLQEDIRALCASGTVASLDAELVAAAIVGIAFEVGAVAVKRGRGDPMAFATFATNLLVNGLAWKPESNPTPSSGAPA